LKNDFEKIRGGSCTLHIHKDFRNDNLEQALLSGEKALREQFGLTTIRSSRFAHVYRFTVRFGDTDRGVYFKQYLCRSARDFIKHLFRAGRAERAFKASAMLAKNGFGAPAVIAKGQYKSGFFNTSNFLVTFEIEGAKPIYQYIPPSPANQTKEQLQSNRRLITAFGQTIGRMHAAGIFHGDLRVGNVLARQGQQGWEFFFLDNERTRKFQRLPRQLRLKNLVQINMHRTDTLTNSDRMRFFNSYLKRNAGIRNRPNKWAERINRKTMSRLRKKLLS